MSNYQETTTTGAVTSWRRARQIILDNPISGAPAATCYEQEATRLPDGTTIEKTTDTLRVEMTDPTVEIPLIDPATFEPTETTITAGEVWRAMASLYLWLARARDEEA